MSAEDKLFLERTSSEIRCEVDRHMPLFAVMKEETITGFRNRQGRTIKQIVGHMVDSASNNHQRIVRLQYNTRLDFPDYRQDNDLWISLQDYGSVCWEELLDLWRLYNYHVAHVIKNADSSALENSWLDFEGHEVTLREMIGSYPDHLRLHLGETDELAAFAASV